MEIIQTEAVRADPAVSALLDRQFPMLDELVHVLPGTATWDLRAGTRGEPRIVLHLEGGKGEATTLFDAVEFRNEANVRSRFARTREAFARIELWRSRLEALYSDLRDWSEDLPSGAVFFEEPVTINEERSGPYEVNRLVIRSGGVELRAEPIASWVVTADGRVDLIGPGYDYVMLYVEGEGWVWDNPSFPPMTRPLTREAFLMLAENCLDA